MEVSKDQLKRAFPNLAQEMDDDERKLAINSVRSDPKTAESTAKAQKNLSNYDPDIIDFLRRCDNKKQAEEIITYMQDRGEITPSYARKLLQQLRKKGIRSFGPKKEEGYYFTTSEQ